MRHRLALSAAIILGVGTIAAVSASGLSPGPSSQPAGASAGAPPTPIKHVVVFMQENHSFNNILGAFCVQHERCTGTTTGTLSTGQTIPLSAAPDVVPNVDHSIKGQTTAIDGGKDGRVRQGQLGAAARSMRATRSTSRPCRAGDPTPRSRTSCLWPRHSRSAT